MLGCCPASRLGPKWWRCRARPCEISNREATICTIKSVSAKPQTAKLHINTQHTKIMKCTLKNVNQCNYGCKGMIWLAIFDCLKSKSRINSTSACIPLIKTNNNIWTPILRKCCTVTCQTMLMRITTMPGDVQTCHHCESIELAHGNDGDSIVVQKTVTINKQFPRQKHESI